MARRMNHHLPELRRPSTDRETGTPVVLVILDGWGATNPRRDFNAIEIARTPNYDRLVGENPNFLIETSGLSVGLPTGQMGNSEVGHLTIGAGKVIDQPLVRINKSIAQGEFFENEQLLGAIENADSNDSALHLVGLVSDGGVHSHQNHLYALLKLAKDRGLKKVYVHAFLDGRDTPPQSAIGYIRALEEKMEELGVGKIATIHGRHYAMDRDKRWDRTKRAFDAMTLSEGHKASSAVKAIEDAYSRGEDDEHTIPTVMVDELKEPVARISNGDSVVFFNFREDRARQLTCAFVDERFDAFERGVTPNVHFACMTQYDEKFGVPVAFPPIEITDTLKEVLTKAGLRVLVTAETEKYPHVTYFMSGGREEPFNGEDRVMVPSPKVATYDLKPEMRADEVTSVVINAIKSGRYDFITVNYANSDMVGHTGKLSAAIKAVETVDRDLGKIHEAVKSVKGTLIVIADHGNSERMLDYRAGEPHTQHTTGVVRGIIVTDREVIPKESSVAGLSRIAPTVLDVESIEMPSGMDRSLLGSRRVRLK